MSHTAADAAIGTGVANVIVPVSDVHRAREWYREALGLSAGEVLFGHLCVIELPSGAGILLDQQLVPGGDGRDVQKGAYPLFMLSVRDTAAALAAVEERGAEVVRYGGEAIQNGHWFNVRDSEGNLLMLCGPPSPVGD